MSDEQRIPVAVVGCGRMGRLHARVYSQMPQVRLIGTYDANPEAAAQTAKEYGGQPFAKLDDLLDQMRAVTIAVPTEHHLSTAEPFLRRGIACLIEKPLAKTVEEGTKIAAIAREHGAVVQVGHIERFNPVIRALERIDLHPGFIEVVRVSPLTFRSLDVGVVLDVMIHDIDIVLKLARSPVVSVDAVGMSITGDVEDICNARLKFANGCIANLTASRMALKTERRLRVFGPEGYVSIDYQKKQGVVAYRKEAMATIRETLRKVRRGEVSGAQLSYADLVQIEQLDIDDVEPLRAELDAFIDAATNKSCRPEVSAEDGVAAVEVATRIVAAIPRSLLNPSNA